MQQEYKVVLPFKFEIGLDVLEDSIKKAHPPYSGLFVPTETEYIKGWLVTKTQTGQVIGFTPRRIHYTFAGELEEGVIISSIKEALELARRLDGHQIQFNPNSIIFHVTFDFEDDFSNQFAPISRNVQKRMYDGGDITYTKSSTDFGVHFGTEQKEKYGVLKSETIKVEGTAQPAA